MICIQGNNKKGYKMRKLEIGSHRFTEINVLDEPGEGGACHGYVIVSVGAINQNFNGNKGTDQTFASVKFQKGPVQEHGVNGCFQEDLIAICIDRLRSFQAGDFKCRENALALTKLEEALHWLNHRTNDRQNRGVEGTNQV